MSDEIETSTHDLAAKVSPWIDAAFERYGQGERFIFMFTVHALPAPPGQPPNLKPAVVFWTPGPMIGSVMSGTFLIDNPVIITHDDIDNVIRQACSEMLNARSQALREVGNGHEPGADPPLHLA